MEAEHKFAFRFTSELRSKHVHFDLISLFDVVLVISLFLFVTHTTAVRPTVPLTLPKGNFIEGVPQGAMVVTVTKEKLFFFNDERTTLNGLSSAFSQMVFKQQDASLIIEADESTPYELLMEVYNQARAQGINQISLAIDVNLPPSEEPAP